MLVHAKNPRGVLYLNEYQIWGKETKQAPKDIPFDLYNQCRDALEDGTYREGYLMAKFGRPCLPIAFTYNELRWLPDKTIDMLTEVMGIDASNLTKKGKIDAIKTELRNVA